MKSSFTSYRPGLMHGSGTKVPDNTMVPINYKDINLNNMKSYVCGACMRMWQQKKEE
jgi:hypothetical protein